MRMIDEMIKDYEDENNSKISLEKLSKKEEDTILKMTLKKAGLEQKKNMRITKRKGIFIAAAAILCLCFASVNVAAYLKLDERFSQFFGSNNQEQINNLSNMGALINKEVENNGYTLKINQIIGDKYTTYILFEIIGPENIVFDKEDYSFDKSYFSIDGPDVKMLKYSMGYGVQTLDDGNPQDNRVSFVIDIESSISLAGKTGKIEFGDIVYYDIKSGSYNTVAKGNWTIDFDMNYTSASKTIDVNKEIEVANGISKITEISVSPMSVSVVMKGDSLKKYEDKLESCPVDYTENGEVIFLEEENDEEPEDLISDEYIPIIVNFKDGTSLKEGRGSGTNLNDGVLIKTISYENLMNIEDIESISVGDVVINMK